MLHFNDDLLFFFKWFDILIPGQGCPHSPLKNPLDTAQLTNFPYKSVKTSCRYSMKDSCKGRNNCNK